jgi:hypothetical protein
MRSRAQQAMIAWRQRAGPSERSQGRKPAEPVARSASLDGAPLVRQRPSMRSWPDTVRRTRASRRYAANDGARNVDLECFLGSSGTMPVHTVPLQCHPKQCADKHLRPPTARSDTVAFILPSSLSAMNVIRWSLVALQLPPTTAEVGGRLPSKFIVRTELVDEDRRDRCSRATSRSSWLAPVPAIRPWKRRVR